MRAVLRDLENGRSATLVTVARTFGSSPRPAGALMAMLSDGSIVGSVSGGCVESYLAQRLKVLAADAVFPRVETFGITREDAQRYGLPCGGRLDLVVERVQAAAPLREIVSALERRELVGRRVCLSTGEVSLHRAAHTQEFFYDGENLEKVFGPQWRLLVIGAGHLSQVLAPMAVALDYDMLVCDPRAGQIASWPVPQVRFDTRMPDEAVTEYVTDARTAVVALTHDPCLDDLALTEALRSPAFYVGALGSKSNNAKRRERLAWWGVAPECIARLHGPVGLPLGGCTPAEIAVAIVADLTATRHGVTLRTSVGDS